MNHTERKPVIEFKDFSFQYFSQAEPTLHDINLTIYEGEKVLLVEYAWQLSERIDSVCI